MPEKMPADLQIEVQRVGMCFGTNPNCARFYQFWKSSFIYFGSLGPPEVSLWLPWPSLKLPNPYLELQREPKECSKGVLGRILVRFGAPLGTPGLTF